MARGEYSARIQDSRASSRFLRCHLHGTGGYSSIAYFLDAAKAAAEAKARDDRQVRQMGDAIENPQPPATVDQDEQDVVIDGLRIPKKTDAR